MSQVVNSKGNKRRFGAPTIALLIIIILGLGGFGYYFYTGVLIPRQAVESINQNISSYNNISDRSAALIKDLDTNQKGFDSSDTSVEAMNRSYEETRDLIKDIDIKITNLSNGKADPAAAEFADSTKNSLTSIRSYLQDYLRYLDYSSCISKNRDTQVKNFNLVADQIGKIDPFEPFNTKNLDATKQVVTLSRTNSQLTGQIGDCFVGEYAIYKDSEIQNNITETQKIFTDFGDAYQALSEGIESQDKSKLETVKAKLESIRYDEIPLFNEPFDVAVVETPSLDFGLKTEALSRIDQDYSDKVDSIKTKFSL